MSSEDVCAEFDDRTMVYGTLVKIDDSFDHEFGREKITTYDLTDVKVVVTVGVHDYDITRSLTDKELNKFRYFLEAKKCGL